MRTHLQATLTLEREDPDYRELEVAVSGTYVPEQPEIRWPTERAQPGIEAAIVDLVARDESGAELELTASEREKAEERLWEVVKTGCEE